MKICVAQTRPVTGDIQRNLEVHKNITNSAAARGVDLIIFPELSLTGYEPTLAKDLETQPDDTGLNDLQLVSDTRNISIGVGIPTKKEKGICISMILFQPYSPRKMYSKKYLHPDEVEFFVRGDNFSSLKIKDLDITFAICYEISVAEHLDQAVKSGSKIYIASVAKFTNSIDKALKTLSATASKYAMTVLMSNCVGQCDGQECGGKSSIWNNRGSLMGQLDNTNEGILVLDVETGEVISETM